MPAKGPFYLVRHISCNTSQGIIDHLGELMHAREYVSSKISGPLSHSPGSVQHKFDSICVLHGEDKCRAICFQATINELQVLRFYRRSRLSAYNDFLDDLEFQWAGANSITELCGAIQLIPSQTTCCCESNGVCGIAVVCKNEILDYAVWYCVCIRQHIQSV